MLKEITKLEAYAAAASGAEVIIESPFGKGVVQHFANSRNGVIAAESADSRYLLDMDRYAHLPTKAD